jgi:hypothetical protein
MSFERLTRMISFRVSEDEFEVLRVKSEACGARSISDYARFALREAPGTTDARDADFDQLSLEVKRLSMDIRRLTDLLEGTPGLPMARRHAASNGDHVEA